MSTAAAPVIVAAASPAAAPPTSVRWALTRAEGRRLVTHPLFVFGMLTSLTALVLADGDAWERSSMLSGDCFVMVGGALWTFVVAFLAVGRERRDAAQDFYRAQPVTARVRSEAALLSVGFAGLAGAALIAIAVLILAGPDGVVAIEPTHHPGQTLPPRTYGLQPIELAQGPMYLMTAGLLGVLAGTWTRHVFAGVFAALLLFLPPVALLPRFVFDHGMSAGFFGSVQAVGPSDWGFTAWHLAAMVGLAALAAAATLARHERGLRVVALALVGGGATVAAAVLGPHLGS